MDPTAMRLFFILSLVAALSVGSIDGAGECGKNTNPDMEALKLYPCAMAARDELAKVTDRCCSQVKLIGKNPSCLCAAMLSDTAKFSGSKPEVAITIPKRCNLADRPVGLKCGAYSLP